MPFCAVWKTGDKSKAVIAFRGTISLYDLKVDFKYEEIVVDNYNVSKGVYNLFQKLFPQINNLLDGVSSAFISGHSLGAGLAFLTALNLPPNITKSVIGFAPPRIGDESFVTTLQRNAKTLSIINLADMVPSLAWSYMPNFSNANDIFQFTTVTPVGIFNDQSTDIMSCHEFPNYYNAILTDKLVFPAL